MYKKRHKDMEFNFDLSRVEVEHLPLPCFLSLKLASLVHELSMFEISP